MLAYNVLFSLMPILIAAALLVSVVVENSAWMEQVTDMFSDEIPAAVTEPVDEMVSTGADNALGIGLIALATLLYGASRMYTGLDRTLARIFCTNRRGYLQQKLYALVIAPLLAATLLASTVLAGVTTALFESSLGKYLDIDASVQERVVAYGVAVSILVVMLSIAYDRIPEHGPGLRHVLVGAIPAAFAVVLLSQIFPIYIRLTGGYSIYGSLLGFSLVFMLWLYLLGQIFVIGAEIIALRAGIRDVGGERSG